MKYEQEINEKLKERNIPLSSLTQDELAELEKEIQVEKEGGVVFDSVLDNPEIYYRDVRKGEGNN